MEESEEFALEEILKDEGEEEEIAYSEEEEQVKERLKDLGYM